MTKRTQLIGRSPRMEQVINLVSRPEFMRILESAYEPERNTFTDRRGGYGGGGGNSEYNGYFKVVETTDESGKAMLKIIDGAKPYSNVAGVSDLGSVGQLTIEKKNSSYLYIYPEWIKDSNPPRYTFKLSTRGNSSIDIEFLLATIDENGIITQRWTDGTIYWGSRFFV